ncbi:MAG: archease [Candidatus Aminicenantes bacterium]|nr:archease [Candidatus Aminicenantes bacterium]
MEAEARLERYRFLDHTADAKFEAFGATLEEAFGNAALAVASVMWDWSRVGRRTRIPVEVSGPDRERLLLDFLEEVLYLLDTRGFLLAGVENVGIREDGGSWRLSADFLGDADPDRYEITGEVKAVTLNEMRVATGPGGASVRVVIDL